MTDLESKLFVALCKCRAVMAYDATVDKYTEALREAENIIFEIMGVDLDPEMRDRRTE